LVSRGAKPSELINYTFWWNGSHWFQTENLAIGPISGSYNADPEENPNISSLTATTTEINCAEKI
jgi:hypothetical protein